jgi:E3 ubiquitin-protein ligase BRE1
VRYDQILTILIENSFKSSLQFEDAEEFQLHLKSRSEDIRAIISQVQSKAINVPAEISDVHTRLAKKLAEEKVTIAELEKTLAEKQQLEESLEAASLRYLVAEKKLDRAKSITVAKLEKQQLMGTSRPGETTQSKREESSPANGGTPVGERNPELEEANNKLSAISEKQKEQLQKLEAENASLLSQITEIKIKVPPTPVAPLSVCRSHYGLSLQNSPMTITHIRICSNTFGHNMTM